MAGTFEATFSWPQTSPSNVIVTGTFDSWSQSTPMTKTQDGFTATLRLPWPEDSKLLFKFVVDGQWLTHPNEPTEFEHGIVNNVRIVTPPPSPTVTAPELASAEPALARPEEFESLDRTPPEQPTPQSVQEDEAAEAAVKLDGVIGIGRDDKHGTPDLDAVINEDLAISASHALGVAVATDAVLEVPESQSLQAPTAAPDKADESFIAEAPAPAQQSPEEVEPASVVPTPVTLSETKSVNSEPTAPTLIPEGEQSTTPSATATAPLQLSQPAATAAATATASPAKIPFTALKDVPPTPPLSTHKKSRSSSSFGMGSLRKLSLSSRRSRTSSQSQSSELGSMDVPALLKTNAAGGDHYFSEKHASDTKASAKQTRKRRGSILVRIREMFSR